MRFCLNRRSSLSEDVSYRKRPGGNSELGGFRRALNAEDFPATDPSDFKSRSRIDDFDVPDMPRMSLEDKFAMFQAGSDADAMSAPTSFIHQVNLCLCSFPFQTIPTAYTPLLVGSFDSDEVLSCFKPGDPECQIRF